MSRLESMRAARDQREHAVLAPVVGPMHNQIDGMRYRMESMEGQISGLSSIITSQISPHIISEMRENVARQIETNIRDTVCRVLGLSRDEIVTVPLSASDVRFMRPDTVTAQILDKASALYRKNSSARVSFDQSRELTILQVELPKAVISIAIDRDHLDRNRRRA